MSIPPAPAPQDEPAWQDGRAWHEPAGQDPSRGRSAITRIIGVALMLPALIVLVVQHLLPAVATFANSTQRVSPFGDDAEPAPSQLGEGLGMLAASLAPALASAVPTMLLAALLALGIAQSARWGWTRGVAHVVLGVAVVCFAPLGVVLALLVLRDLDAVQSLADVAVGLPVATALLATVLLCASRASRPVLATLVALAVALLAGLGLAAQASDVSITVGGDSPASLIYRTGLQQFDLGMASAVSAGLLVWLGVLGTLVVVLLAATRARLAPTPAPRPIPLLGIVGLVSALVLAGVVVTVVAIVLATPGASAEDVVGTGVRTWGGAALGALAAVVVGGLAAVGIGWCRPLGDHSAWLLLPFAPALLVGPLPILMARLLELQQAELLDTVVAAASPVLVAPVTVVLALVLLGPAGHEAGAAWRAGGAAALLLLVVITVCDAQSLLPQLALVSSPELQTVPVALVATLSIGAAADPVLALPPVLLLAAALAVVAQLGLGRLGLELGRRARP